jgi:cytochrome c oxidase subunit II
MVLAASEITREVDRAFWLIGGMCVLLFLGVTIAMIAIVFKYHRSRAKTTTQTEGHKWLEVTWIVIPTLIVTWMFFVGFEGFGLMRQVPDDAMVVEVTGRQWSWSFYYPEEKINTTKMFVPFGKAIKCELSAPPGDVIHSFYIPRFRVKEDVRPGQNSYMWFQADVPKDGKARIYNIFCAEFCGKDHAKMIAELHVVSEEEYRNWVRKEQTKKYEPLIFEAITNPDHEKFGPEQLGIDVDQLYGTYCASCHGQAGDGSGLPGVARDFRSLEGWKNGGKVVDIYRTLVDGIEGTQMRGYPNLSPWERVGLAHKVRSFLKEPAPVDTQEDFDALVTEYELDKIQPPKESIPIEQAMELLVEEAVTTQPTGNTP